MTGKSRTGFPGVGARCIEPARGARMSGSVGGLVGGAPGGVGGCRCPLSVLDLANNRVVPNSPHPSSGREWAGRPCSATGSTQGRVGLAPPSASVASSGLVDHLLGLVAAGDGGVPSDASGHDDEELAQQGRGDGGAGLAVTQWVAGAGG